MHKNWWMAGAMAFALSAGGMRAFSETANTVPQQQVLDSARRAYNESKFPLAVDRFREFLKSNPGSPDAISANFGLGVALLQSPDNDPGEAIEPLTRAADNAAFANRPQAMFCLAQAMKTLTQKSPETPQSQQRLVEVVTRLTEAVKLLDGRCEKLSPDENGDLPLDLDFALRARSELTDVLLRLKRYKEAAEVAKVVVDNPKLAKTAYASFARYQLGLAFFQLGDSFAAGKALAPLAPFAQDFGPHALYMLARIHQLGGERPEALADYKALLDVVEKKRGEAAEELKKPDLSPARRQLLEAATGAPAEFVQRASFYYALLLADSGKVADGLDLLKKFMEGNHGSPLATEAQLRLGLLQLQSNAYADALNTLRPLFDDKQFADQALWFAARAQASQFDPANPQTLVDAQRSSLDFYRRAAEKAATAAKTSADAKARRLDILLEYIDVELALKQFKDAAALSAILYAEAAAGPTTVRAEEALERQITSLHLAGSISEAEPLAQKFVAAYPKSLLLPSVLFRSAEGAYLNALAVSNDPKRAASAVQLFADASKRYEKLISDYPDFPQLAAARFYLASAYYRQNKFTESAEVCKTIADADRIGDLVSIYYLHGDALLRSLPPEGDDAIATSKMLLHAEAASRNLTAFVTLAGPKNPQFADASMKLAYTQQRIAGVLADPQEKRKALTTARDAYDKILTAIPWDNSVAAAASLERAKVLALLGDVPSADRELRRFTTDPYMKAPNAPLAILRLANLLRATGRPQEAADILKSLRDRDEVSLLKDPVRTSWVPAIQYEYALSLQEANKVDEARSAYTALIAASPASVEAGSARYRIAQCQRLLLANAIATARKTIRASTSPEAIDVARRTLDVSYRSMLEWTNATVPEADDLLKKSPSSDSTLRILYELAWGYRVLGEAQLEAARSKMSRDQLADVLLKSQKNPAAGYVKNSGLTPPSLSASAVSVQAMETKSREAYRKLIASADAASNALALQARIELAEILAVRGKPDEALELLTDALDKNPPAGLADRARTRVAATLLEKGDPKNALAQTAYILKNPLSPMFAEARYLAGEALIAQKDYPKAIEMLNVFNTDPRFLSVPETTDKALLRLSYALAQSSRWDESRQIADVLVQRFPQSICADEARFASAWALQSLKRFDEAAAAYTEITKRSASETAARAQLQIGLIRLDQKKFADAAKALLVVPYTYSYSDLDAPAWYNTGLAYLELKNLAEAKIAFERLTKNYPQSQYAAPAQQKLSELR